MSYKNEFVKVIFGIILLLLMHTLAGLLILLITNILQAMYDGNSGLYVLIFASGICLWQLLYVIPTCLWLQQKRKHLIMKGVIIGAEITFLLNGGCFLLVILSIR